MVVTFINATAGKYLKEEISKENMESSRADEESWQDYCETF